MKATSCGIIAPRQEEMCGVDRGDYLAECVLPRSHYGAHEFVTPDGRRYAWEYDYKCGCCPPEEDQRCAVSWKL
jgi:hypothetical protein